MRETATKDRQGKGKLVLIIGPSGVGKSVILKELRRRHTALRFPRSATTRERRPGEGTELYHFLSNTEFDRLMEEGGLLEWAVVHGGARYGTLLQEIVPPIEEGRIVVREVDVQGFDSIRAHPLFRSPDAPHRLQSIFILPESRKQLIAHITKRSPMSGPELERRIASMDRELTYAPLCDAQVTSREGQLPRAIGEVERAILAG